ncbi:rhoptry-associated membrane antigen [Plasmodium gonderi]|uniref:Rhoptry-associated membrane antigen n=1 Tax=Plasmodium gonderi TaxID=77519 RepID=A0A1Y1JB44_PLAGO|nr:rhoptry-associated membrane antigen [Plasmodium gonderi]GAW78908.1 rhoptry-associated membrane antigen [Plasmodium gonderi]
MNILFLSFFIIQNITTYFEQFKNGINTQYVKDKAKCDSVNRTLDLNNIKGEDGYKSSDVGCSYFNLYHQKIDMKKLYSFLSTSKNVNPFQYILRNNESMKILGNSSSYVSPNRLSRKLNEDMSKKKNVHSNDSNDSDDIANSADSEDSFLEKNKNEKTHNDNEEEKEHDEYDEEQEESFLEKEEYEDVEDNEHDEFDEEQAESFLEKEEYEDVEDNEHEEFDEEQAESFLQKDQYDTVGDNEHDEFDKEEELEQEHGESFLEKEDDDDDDDSNNENNGKEYKEEYKNKLPDEAYPDEYVGSDESNESNGSNGKVGIGVNRKENTNVKESKTKGNESFLEKNINEQSNSMDEKHSTFVSSYLDDENPDDKHNNKIYDEDSFLERDSHNHNDDDESDDTFDDYEDSFLERGKIGSPYDDYYEHDAEDEDFKEENSNEEAFDNHHLNHISSTGDVNSFLQKDMEFIDEMIDDNETIKDAVKKGSNKTEKQKIHKPNLLDEENIEDKDPFLSEEEINGFMEENMDASKLDTKKNKTILRNSEKNKNISIAENKETGKGVPSELNNAETNSVANNTSQFNKGQTDLTNEDLFNDEFTEEVIADSYEGGNLETTENENMTESLDENLLDQGVNENTLLNDNNMIFNAKMVPHKKRDVYISPYKHTSSTNNKNNKHHTEDVDALDKKLRPHELLELENGEGGNSVIVETEEVDVDLNKGKSSSCTSFISSVVLLLIGLLYIIN